MDFSQKVVLITGASGGIGSETALLFGKYGAKVIVNYCSSQIKADSIVKAIQSYSGEAFFFRADISKPKEVRSMIETTIERFNKLDILINNASQHPPPSFDFEKPNWTLWKRMIDVNVMGILVCSYFAASFLKKTKGNIVNVVMDHDPGGLGYVLTKAAGTPITRGLARELAPVRVNAVSPGPIDTWGMNQEEKAYFMKTLLLERVGHPLDIAKVILFLASDNASFITGETIHVDGGRQLLI